MMLKGISLFKNILKSSTGWIKEAHVLTEVTQNSIGLKARTVTKFEIWIFVNDYILKVE